MLDARRLEAGDLLTIERQVSQRVLFGMPLEIDEDDAAERAADPVAWTLRDRRGRIVACLGIGEVFEGVHGTAWAVLAPGIGADHHALTSFMRGVVDLAARRLWRIEAVVADGAPARWARLVGVPPVYLMREFGAWAEPHWLCERIRERSA